MVSVVMLNVNMLNAIMLYAECCGAFRATYLLRIRVTYLIRTEW
jgi:hypothetical protein